jgi:hypothetical protein
MPVEEPAMSEDHQREKTKTAKTTEDCNRNRNHKHGDHEYQKYNDT